MVLHLSDEMKERRKENVKFRDEQKQAGNNPSTAGGSRPVVISDDEDEEEEEEDEEEEPRYIPRNRDYRRRWYHREDRLGHYYNSETDGTLSGDPDAEYGGYGPCHNCGRNGHWWRGCPLP